MFESVLKFVNLKPLDIHDVVGFAVPSNEGVRTILKEELEKCITKYHGYCKISIQPPYKKRTTGKNSQNHRLNGFIRQLSQFTGQDFDSLKLQAKIIAMQRYDYPYDEVEINGETYQLPWSETRLNTVQCGYLISVVEWMAAEVEFILKEE